MKRGLVFARGARGAASLSGSVDAGWLAAAGQSPALDAQDVVGGWSAEAAVADALATQESTAAAEDPPSRDAASLRWRVVAALALLALALQSLALWWALPASDPATRGYVETRLGSVVTTLAGAESSIEQLRGQLNELAARPQDVPSPTVAAANTGAGATPPPATLGADQAVPRDGAISSRVGASGQTATAPDVVVVALGDTAAAIARRAGVSLTALAEANDTTIERLSFIRAGAVLLVPPGAAE